jgi:hypothetical protein
VVKPRSKRVDAKVASQRHCTTSRSDNLLPIEALCPGKVVYHFVIVLMGLRLAFLASSVSLAVYLWNITE